MIIKHICNAESFGQERSVIALGNFDGVHFAHARLIKKAKEIATSLCTTAGERILTAVFTFSDPKKPFLTSMDEKLAAFERLGVDTVFLCPFEDVRNMSPEEFVREILIKKLSCTHTVCGFNYRFGRGASGDTDTLRTISSGLGLNCTVIDEISGVSSTKIRDLVSSGNIESAYDLLGRPYSLSGEIVHGRGVGHTFNCPTLNIDIPDGKLLPARGVYFTECKIDGQLFPSVTNVGVCPTFNGDRLVCENHLLDVNADFYGQRAEVFFLKFHRSEIAFSSPEELYKTVSEDVRAARDYYLSKFE